MMIIYKCDWCKVTYPLNGVTTVKLKNVYNKAIYLHICRICARDKMPESAQSMLSWTADA
jgi:hypothetical protein